MDNKITTELLIIKSFQNIYLLDNYCFKDLIIKIKGIYLGIQVKNTSRCNSRLIKSLKKKSKLNQSWELGSALESANWHSWSANRHMLSVDRHFSFELEHLRKGRHIHFYQKNMSKEMELKIFNSMFDCKNFFESRVVVIGTCHVPIDTPRVCRSTLPQCQLAQLRGLAQKHSNQDKIHPFQIFRDKNST